MSRLGDLLHTERLRRKMTLKQVAKIGGVSEGYLKDVEEGKKIIADDQARRILKKMGLEEHTEQGFTLDDIAATVDLETVTVKKPVPSPATKSASTQEKTDSEAVYSDHSTVEGSVWLDALTSVMKAVPVYNAVMKETERRLLPILDGKIEGANPDKVFFFTAPDDSMRGFRILKDDLCLLVPAASPIDNAVMLVMANQHRFLRKVKKLDAMNVLLQSYDREYAAEPYAITDISFVGRVTKVEFSL